MPNFHQADDHMTVTGDIEGCLCVYFVQPTPPRFVFYTICTSIIYHPFLRISSTLLTVALNASLNLRLHRSDASLFLFVPPRSWNLCLLKSCLTRFVAHLISRVLNALAKSMFPAASTATVLPKLGPMRKVGGDVSTTAACLPIGPSIENASCARPGIIIRDVSTRPAPDLSRGEWRMLLIRR